MEVEGTKTTLRPQKAQAGARSKGKLLNVVREKRRNKLSKKKQLQTILKKKKKMNEMADEAGKDWKIVLREKFEQTCQASGPNLAFGLSRLFHEENRSLMARVVEILGDDDAKEAAKRALEAFITGGLKKADAAAGERSMGGIFFKIIKDNLGPVDPVKLKAIFIKSEGAKKRKHQIRKLRKKQDKQNPQLGTRLMNNSNNKVSSNPYENIFNALV